MSGPADLTAGLQTVYENLFEEALAERIDMELLGRRDLDSLLAVHEAALGATSCVDDECMASAAHLFDVRYYVTGTFNLIDGGIFLSIRVIDRSNDTVPVRSARVLGSDLVDIERNLGRLAAEVAAKLEDAVDDEDATPGIWTRLDAHGKVGVATLAGGLVAFGVGLAFVMEAEEQAAQVRETGDGLHTNQPAARSARNLGWAANGFWLGGGLLLLGGGLLVYNGWNDSNVIVQASPDGVGASIRGRF